jgi:drug/metabolite transporter (DMT)-like permease
MNIYLAGASLAGFLLFSEVPGVWTLVGAAIVVASTLFITWREQRALSARPR